jgi:pimeloyl-ACP methyl ester carboxylesterase
MSLQTNKLELLNNETQFLKRSEGRLAYDESGGSGQLVIMVPGMGALRSEYRFLAPVLIKAGYRAVTMDLRGQGESDVNWSEYSIPKVGQDILKLIDHLNSGPAHVIGTSMSPRAIVWAAAERPDLIRSLILISPFVRDGKLSFGQKIGLAILLRGPWKVNSWISYYKSLYPTAKPHDFDDYLEALKSNLKEPDRFKAMMKLGSTPRKPSEERLNNIEKPVLVIMGTKDPDWSNPEDEASYITDKLSAELLLVEGAGHYPQTEMPKKVYPTILDFLKRS